MTRIIGITWEPDRTTNFWILPPQALWSRIYGREGENLVLSSSPRWCSCILKSEIPLSSLMSVTDSTLSVYRDRSFAPGRTGLQHEMEHLAGPEARAAASQWPLRPLRPSANSLQGKWGEGWHVIGGRQTWEQRLWRPQQCFGHHWWVIHILLLKWMAKTHSLMWVEAWCPWMAWLASLSDWWSSNNKTTYCS